MSYLKENEKAKCQAIIHSASAASGVVGAGLAWGFHVAIRLLYQEFRLVWL